MKGCVFVGLGKDNTKYEHYVPMRPEVVDWHKKFIFELVETMDKLRSIFSGLDDNTYLMSFDTETTSLDPEEGFLVGFSFCLDGKTAYYVAVNHFESPYNLGDEALDFIYERMCNAKRVFTFNMKFDSRYMEYHGYIPEKHKWLRFSFIKYDMSKVKMYDVSVPCFYSDTNVPYPSLKLSTLRFLGFRMQSFAEVTGGVENFHYTDPRESAFYAASDALCTYLLTPATLPFFQEGKQAAIDDVNVLYPLQHYEQEKVFLDGNKLIETDMFMEKHINNLEKEVYDSVGYVFNLNSPMQVSEAFSRLGIDTGATTKTGYMKTGIGYLEELPEEVRNQYPALKAFIEYKTAYKFRSSYIKVLRKIHEDKGFLRCNYKTQTVPTGRLASGKDAKNSFFSEINVQSVPKPHPGFFYVLDLEDRNLFSAPDNIIAGYQFILQKTRENADGKKEVIPGAELYPNSFIGNAEGMHPNVNARACITPKFVCGEEEGESIWCSIDYCISPDTFVELEDGRKVPMHALEGMKDVIVKTPYGYKRAYNFRYTGKKQVCKLTMKSGRVIKCSPDHKFLVVTSNGTEVWKALCDIVSSDSIVEDVL